MYTQTLNPDIVVRDEDGAFIPNDPDNVDYQEYQEWIAEGNVANPYSPPVQAKPAGKKNA